MGPAIRPGTSAGFAIASLPKGETLMHLGFPPGTRATVSRCERCRKAGR